MRANLMLDTSMCSRPAPTCERQLLPDGRSVQPDGWNEIHASARRRSDHLPSPDMEQAARQWEDRGRGACRPSPDRTDTGARARTD